ncbi:uncharacterized protein CLUP02_12812 [Colletotrichum lupini]|uniref:Uncharacterized protein n=1 Tax=Colletotrichum lupini TaxID=145971 RepID=A0A9Q8WKU4_9PEZI|nr:uncharacterized protein CLUP02_12812 [Colletotrichum lupini]UQC87308.1 hypothetical protein CLUP02_12812 [Colletotrichum lupini]
MEVFDTQPTKPEAVSLDATNYQPTTKSPERYANCGCRPSDGVVRRYICEHPLPIILATLDIEFRGRGRHL